jgi:hypothetical protein
MSWLRSHKVLSTLAIIAVAVLIMMGWLWAAPVRGRLAAHYDVARGHYRELTYGLPVEWMPEYRELLKKRYGVDSIAVTGCTVSPGLISYVAGYNSVSTAVVNKRFGHDVFSECARDAQTNWNTRPLMEQLFPNAAKKATSVDCFRAFSRHNSVDQVALACGRPDEDKCSGIACFVWRLDDGNTIILRTTTTERIDELILAEKSGMESSLLGDESKLSAPPTTLRFAK